MAYRTKQQQAVLNCLAAHSEGQVTALQLADELRAEGVGITTVYRQLEKLSSLGRIHKINTPDGACYQYCDHAEGGCFLLKCESCGRIVHLDCSHLGGLYRHVAEEHHFVVDPHKTMFYGLCELCAQEKGNL